MGSTFRLFIHFEHQEEKMKHTKLFTAIAAGLALLASSCSNLADANVSSSDSSTRTLNIAVTNYSDLVAASQSISASKAASSLDSAARTIIPDSFTLSGIKLYLYGIATNGKEFGPAEVTPTDAGSTTLSADAKVGVIDIPAQSYNWEFTLYAIDSSDSTTVTTTTTGLATGAVLLGHASMDMANGDTAKFTLSPDGLTKTADVALKLYLDSSWTAVPSGYSATAGIYLLTTGADATDTGAGEGTATEKQIYADIADATTPFPTSAPTSDNFTVSSMAPGTYLFKVTFANSTTGKKFVWSDVIIVLPGKKLDNTVAIPNVIGVKPADQTSFKAAYVAASEDKTNGYYTVELEWDRPSTKNENYYEIDVLELSSTNNDVSLPTDATATDLSSYGTTTTYDADFSSENCYVSGSLLSGSTTAQLHLELGKRYWARIRAVNDAGASSYIAVSLAATTNGTAFTSTTINRYRIRYNLNGGTIYSGTTAVDTTSLSGGSTADIVAYFCQKAEGNAVIKPDNKAAYTVDSKYYYLTNGSYDWSYWKDGENSKLGEDTDTVIPSYLYKSYTNLELYAAYAGTGSVSILDKSLYDIKAAWISVDGTDLTGNTASIDTSSVTSSVWKITPADIKDASGTDITATFAYNTVNFTVAKGGMTYYANSATNVGSSGATFTLPLDTLDAGVYQVTFTGIYNATIVSCAVTTTITR